MIITADDLGFSPSRNEAILAATAVGTVSSASLMVHMPWAEAACESAQKQTPDLGLGLHFTLTSGRPVSPPETVPLLVDQNGMFRHGFVSLYRNASRTQFLSQISLEFDAQLRRMDELKERYALNIDHLDSHQHVHAIGPIWNILEKAGRARQLRIRIPREPYGALRRTFPFRSLLPIGDMKKTILDFCTRNVVSDHVYFGVLESGQMGLQAWKGILHAARRYDGPVEVNTHPGTLKGDEASSETLCCSRDDRNFHRSAWRKKELEVLLSDEFRNLLERNGMLPLKKWKDV